MRRLLRKYMVCEDTNHGVKVICNAVGVYKNGSGIDEDSLLNSLSGSYIKEKIMQIEDMEVYPNPTDGVIKIKYNLQNDAEIVFYTVIGQEVFKMQMSKNVNFIQGNLPQLPLGIYTYKIISGNTCIKNGKLIVK